MIPMIYIVIALAWLLLIAGFVIEDYWILAFASLLLMILGLYICFYGLTDFDNIVTQAFGMIHIGIGAYVMIRGATEVYKDAF